ncbi:hypothetical protein [Nonomuraea endophytica]|uniref:Uncharacterized protein n=1 Tax=Nonomuraea endophytica TaxID=714136 RepID=A0A7W8AAQ2_9ACTN|nr:hypothetical protein [Nonomuraea endophytica]MBB5082680.1 hypothetical protein [Nonomuraea endophytica]
MLVAAVAVVVIAGGAAVALRGEPRQHPIPAIRPTPTLAPNTPTRFTGAEPVEKVWPAAVTKIPGKLPGGAKIRPPKGVSISSWTVGTDRVFWSTVEAGGSGLWSVPLEGGSTKRLATVPGRVDTMVVAGDRLAVSLMDGGGVSTVPLGGGKMEAVRGPGVITS